MSSDRLCERSWRRSTGPQRAGTRFASSIAEPGSSTWYSTTGGSPREDAIAERQVPHVGQDHRAVRVVTSCAGDASAPDQNTFSPSWLASRPSPHPTSQNGPNSSGAMTSWNKPALCTPWSWRDSKPHPREHAQTPRTGEIGAPSRVRLSIRLPPQMSTADDRSWPTAGLRLRPGSVGVVATATGCSPSHSAGTVRSRLDVGVVKADSQASSAEKRVLGRCRRIASAARQQPAPPGGLAEHAAPCRSAMASRGGDPPVVPVHVMTQARLSTRQSVSCALGAVLRLHERSQQASRTHVRGISADLFRRRGCGRDSFADLP